MIALQTLFLLLIVQMADIVTTYIVLSTYPDVAVELNPLMNLVLSSANPLVGMIILKVIAALACSAVIEIIRRKDNKSGRLVLIIALLSSGLPVAFNIWNFFSMR